MIEQLVFEEFVPSEEERLEARRILNGGLAVRLGIGQENAITTKRLAEQLFSDVRSVTLAVYNARRSGIPICSGQDGFFLPRSESDCIICAAGMNKRAEEIKDSAEAVLSGWRAGWRPHEEVGCEDGR